MTNNENMKSIEKAWFTLGRCFSYLPNQKIILEKFNLLSSDLPTDFTKFKEEVFFKIANEISRQELAEDILVEAKTYFAESKDTKLEPSVAQYYFHWGVDSETIIENVLTFAEASEQWGLDDSTLRKLVTTDKLQEGIDYRKSGRTWLITKGAMKKIYGKPKN